MSKRKKGASEIKVSTFTLGFFTREDAERYIAWKNSQAAEPYVSREIREDGIYFLVALVSFDLCTACSRMRSVREMKSIAICEKMQALKVVAHGRGAAGQSLDLDFGAALFLNGEYL